GNEVVFVTYLYRTRNRPDLVIGEKSHQVVDGVVFELGIRIDTNHKFILRMGDTEIQRRCFTSIWFAKYLHQGMMAIGGIHQLESLVLRSVIHKNYFKRRVINFKQALDGFYGSHFLVVARHYNANRRKRTGIDFYPAQLFIIGILPDSQYPDKHHAADCQENGRQKQVQQKPVAIKIKFNKEIIQ